MYNFKDFHNHHSKEKDRLRHSKYSSLSPSIARSPQ